MKMRLVTKNQEVSGVHSFIFEPEQPMEWQPGQYLHYVLDHPNPDDRGTERWFTIASAPYEQNIRLTTRFDGEKMSSFKSALLGMEPNDTVEADGPKGSFTLKEGDNLHILIAGGIGITPYRAMILQLAHNNQKMNIDLLYANRDEAFVFDEELADVAAAHQDFNIHKFVDKHIEKSDISSYLSEPNSIFYLSGPRAMVESYEGMLGSAGINEDHIVTDYFPGY